MDVGPAFKSGDEVFVPREMREDHELDLRVVRGDELEALFGAEGRADAPPVLVADRDVLEVRVPARKATGRGSRLDKARVHAAR